LNLHGKMRYHVNNVYCPIDENNNKKKKNKKKNNDTGRNIVQSVRISWGKSHENCKVLFYFNQ